MSDQPERERRRIRPDELNVIDKDGRVVPVPDCATTSADEFHIPSIAWMGKLEEKDRSREADMRLRKRYVPSPPVPLRAESAASSSHPVPPVVAPPGVSLETTAADVTSRKADVNSVEIEGQGSPVVDNYRGLTAEDIVYTESERGSEPEAQEVATAGIEPVVPSVELTESNPEGDEGVESTVEPAAPVEAVGEVNRVTGLPTPEARDVVMATDENEIDPDQPIFCPASGVTHPAPSTYDDVRMEDNIRLYGKAPWFHRQSLRNEEQIRRYSDERGFLPGGIPVGMVFGSIWRRQNACRTRDLYIAPDRPEAIARGYFALDVMEGLNRLQSLIGADDATTMYAYRTYGERDYVNSLSELTADQMVEWRGRTVAHPNAVRFTHPLLKKEFRFTQKTGAYWQRYVRAERRNRNVFGRAIPYHVNGIYRLKAAHIAQSCPRLIDAWRQVEVPRGCNVEAPLEFTYKNLELFEGSSGWWLVAFSGFAAKTAAFVLYDVYDSFRLWALSPNAIRNIRALNLVTVLGNKQNADECLHLMGVIEGTNFREYPAAWSDRGRVEDGNCSPGRTGTGADWIWYDPVKRRTLTFKEAEELAVRATRMPVPADHPIGWDYADFENGYDMPAVGHVVRTGAAGEDAYGWDGDEEVDESTLPTFYYPSANDAVVPVSAVEAVALAAHVQCGQSNATAYPLVPTLTGSRDNTALIRDFLVDVGFPAERFARLSYVDLRAYLRGRLER